jgi:DNA-binding PadR family transcriptional regulator
MASRDESKQNACSAVSFRYTDHVLDLAILGLLQESDLHGYEIRRRLRDSLGLMANISFGSLYPALSRLERQGAVSALEPSVAPGPGVAMGSLSGELAALRARRSMVVVPKKARKVYRITPAGRELFTRLLEDPSAGDDARTFSLRLSFARHLSPDVRRTLLERRRAHLVDRLGEVRGATTRNDLDVYARAVVEHTADGVASDIAWLDRLLADEGQRSTPSQHPSPANGTVPSASTSPQG